MFNYNPTESRLRAFQPAKDKSHMLPLTPQFAVLRVKLSR